MARKTFSEKEIKKLAVSILQNGLLQAKQFKEIAGVTAMALTKLERTAKGGIVIAVADALQIPVKYIGVGEKAEDLMPFDARDFVNALL